MIQTEESRRIAAIATGLVSRLEPDDAALVLIDLKRMMVEREMEDFVSRLLDTVSDRREHTITDPRTAMPAARTTVGHTQRADACDAPSAQAREVVIESCTAATVSNPGATNRALVLLSKPLLALLALAIGYLLGFAHAIGL
jgi:hypothetical protein